MEKAPSAGAKPENATMLAAGMVLLVYMLLAPILSLFVLFLLNIDLWLKVGMVVVIGAGLIVLGLLNMYLYSRKGKKIEQEIKYK